MPFGSKYYSGPAGDTHELAERIERLENENEELKKKVSSMQQMDKSKFQHEIQYVGRELQSVRLKMKSLKHHNSWMSEEGQKRFDEVIDKITLLLDTFEIEFPEDSATKQRIEELRYAIEDEPPW